MRYKVQLTELVLSFKDTFAESSNLDSSLEFLLIQSHYKKIVECSYYMTALRLVGQIIKLKGSLCP